MTSAKAKYILAMFIFGSVGIFIREIPLPSSVIALIRGLLGCLFLLLFLLIRKEKLSKERIKKDLLILILSGAAIGINWVFLFESYNYTSIANATVCYYMAPIFVIIITPVIFREKPGIKRLLCIIAAVIGIVLITGVGGGASGAGASGEAGDITGIAYGLLAAVFYATVIVLNKFLRRSSDYERSLVQLFIAGIVLLPYVLVTGGASQDAYDSYVAIGITSLILLLVVGLVHTGFAYYLYFAGLKKIKAMDAATLCYIDPLTAIILAAIIFRERMGLAEIIGALLVFGGTLFAALENAKAKGTQSSNE